jgi:hypothetical protein
MTNFKYQVTEQVWDGKSMLDEKNFYHQNQGEPSQLTKKLTYILGDYNNNYPIMMMTSSEIAKKGSKVELDDVQFTYPVMGRDDKASKVAESQYSVGDKPGYGNSEFVIRFTDNWIKRYYIIESARGVQAYVTADPEKKGKYWEYKVQLQAARDTQYCPLSELEAGTLWVDLNVQVAESESRGSDSKMVAPGSYKNQMGFVRASMSWAGNAANKIMNIKVKTDKGATDVWMDFFMWQFEKRWLNECEHACWYSRYNRKADGSISLKDKISGKEIPIGSGLLEQIQNKSTYSKLTYESLQNRIGEALYGQSDTDNMSITLFTGKGGLREMDRAMKAEGVKFVTQLGENNNKFISGQGKDLMLGGFFSGFYHIDGYTVKVKYNPIFDLGKIAMKSPLHPESGYPLESYRMVFIDDSDYDGQPNIQAVCQKGREYKHGVVMGMADAPKSLKIMGGFNLSANEAQLLSSDVDKASYHRFKSLGIQILRASKCFDLQCVAGL